MPARRGSVWKIFFRKVGGNFLRFRKRGFWWKFLRCPQGRDLTRIFSMSAREGFEVVVVDEVVEVVVVGVMNNHVDDVDE